MEINPSIKLSAILLYLAGTLVSIICAFYLGKLILESTYIQFFGFPLLIGFIFLSLAGTYRLLKLDRLRFESNELVISNLLGIEKNRIGQSEVTSFTVIKKTLHRSENKSIEYEELDLYFSNMKYRISSLHYSDIDYAELKKILIHNKQINHQEINKWEDRSSLYSGVFFVLFSILLIYMALSHDKLGDVTSSNTAFISGVISSEVAINKSRRGRTSLILELENYPNFTFYLNRPEIKAFEKNKFLNEVKKGDEIKLRIYKTSLNKKLQKTEELSWSDKRFHFSKIEILGVVRKDVDYLPLQEMNIKRTDFDKRGNKYWGLGVGFLMLIIGIFMLYISRLPQDEFKK